MTQKEFWRRVTLLPWEQNIWGEIRCAEGDCPLGAARELGDDLSGLPLAAEAAPILGLPIRFARRIQRAADSPRSKYRPWLLKHLGVRAPHEETPTP